MTNPHHGGRAPSAPSSGMPLPAAGRDHPGAQRAATPGQHDAPRRQLVAASARSMPEPVTVRVDPRQDAASAVTVLPATAEVVVSLQERATFDTAAVAALIGEVAAALQPRAGALDCGEEDLRIPIDIPGRGAVVLRARIAGVSLLVQLGGVAVRVPAGDAVRVFSRIAKLAIRAGSRALRTPGSVSGAATLATASASTAAPPRTPRGAR